MTEPEPLSRSISEVVADHPYKGPFDIIALKRWLERDHHGELKKGFHHTAFTGERGYIENASLNVKWHYIRCMEEHNSEDAAREWVTLQGWRVSSVKSHVPAILQELFAAGRTEGLAAVGGSTDKSVTITEEPQIVPEGDFPW